MIYRHTTCYAIVTIPHHLLNSHLTAQSYFGSDKNRKQTKINLINWYAIITHAVLTQHNGMGFNLSHMD